MLQFGSQRRSKPLIESLERRTLFAVAVGTTLPSASGLPGGAPTDIPLAGAFDDTSVEGLVVRLNTSLGEVDLELFDAAAPKTVQNFANYVANNLYNQTVLHRLVSDFVIQGGGYLQTGAHIQEGPTIKNEFSPARPNLRGTISMATLPSTDSLGNPLPGGGADSATSEWVINLADNPTLDAANGGFTVFGQVINGTMGVIDEIAQLPIADASAVTPVFAELPVRNKPAGVPSTDDFLFINSAEFISDAQFLTLSATSDAPTIVDPTVSNGVLRLNYGSQSGSANITVTARDSSGNEASQTFLAGVGEFLVTIGAGGIGSKLNFAETDGGSGSISLKKGGTAVVRMTGEGLVLTEGKKPSLAGTVSTISNITTTGTGANSSLTIKTRGGDGAVDVHGIATDGPLKNLALKSTRLTGATTIGGAVRKAALGDLTNADVVFGGSAGGGSSLDLTLGVATDSNITSGMPIKSIKASQFLDTVGTPGMISAPSVATISTKGALQESIETPGGAIRNIKAGGVQKGNITADSLQSLSAQDLQGGIWNFSQAFASGRDAVKKIAVRGSITGTTVRAAGSIGSISASSVTSGRVYAGVDVQDDEFPPFLPADPAQFTSPARIGKLSVKSDADQLSVAAATLGKVSFVAISTDAAIPFGLAAMQIDQLTGKTADTELGPGTPIKFKDLSDQGTIDAIIDAQLLPLGNFVVRLF